MTEKRNVLIVVAHPDGASFNHAMANAAAEALRGAGHSVTVSDLSAMGFRADLGPHDMTGAEGADRFHIQAAQAGAARTGTFADDIAQQQARVAAADNIILQFPMWWGGPPALLKGWADRVLAYGFAYVDGRRFDTGLFQGRRAMLSVTTGGTPQRFSPQGVYGPIGPLLMPLQRLTLEYMGFTVEQPYIAHGVPRTDLAERQKHLADFAQAALDMAAKPVSPTDAWRTALDEVAEGAWASKN